jgi:signal transduction histidine kinase
VPGGLVNNFGGTLPRSTARARVETFQWQYFLGLAALVLLYYGAAHLGYAFHFAGPVAAIVWLPTGVGIAFLYLTGLRFWPGVLIGDLLVNNYSALPVGSAVAQSCGNVLEIVVATILLRRLAGRRSSPLASVQGVAGMLIAIAAGTALSATIGMVSLSAAGVVSGGHSWLETWRTWWLGDFSGGLIVVAPALAWSTPSPHWLDGRAYEGALLLAVVVGLSALALDSDLSLTYLVFPAVIWAALRFGQRGATVAVTIVSAFTIWSTTHYHGPFAFRSIDSSILSAQLYIAVGTISALCLAAVVSERESLARRLRVSRSRVVEAADRERTRLERDLHDGAQQRLLALATHLALGAEEAADDPSRADSLLKAAEAEVVTTLDELRGLARGMRPPDLSRYGIGGAIEPLLLASPIAVHVENAPKNRFDDRVEATAYFVILEGITNSQRHSKADRIWVKFTSRAEALVVEIGDDGIGGAIENAGVGLESLRDRVEAIGGVFHVTSPPGRGTLLTAELPLSVAAQPARRPARRSAAFTLEAASQPGTSALPSPED